MSKKVDTKLILENKVYKVNSDDIEVQANILVCCCCNEEIYYKELDDAILINVYNKYRKKHKLLLPEEIKQIRALYGLSQRGFAKLLNWGDKTIRRYENGSIQDKAHNSLLMFLKKPENMKEYILENENSLDEKHLSGLLELVDKLINKNELEDSCKFFDCYFSNEPSIDNGFKNLITKNL